MRGDLFPVPHRTWPDKPSEFTEFSKPSEFSEPIDEQCFLGRGAVAARLRRGGYPFVLGDAPGPFEGGKKKCRLLYCGTGVLLYWCTDVLMY